jgi:hypothetical protein
MEHYLQQLIDDFHKATYNVRPPSEIWDTVDLDDEGEIEDISYIEQNYGELREPLSEIVGIEKVLLPPEHRLTDVQVSKLVHEMIDLLNFFHFNPDFPEELPDRIKYTSLLDIWDTEQVTVSFGEITLEFCDYNEKNCPFHEYCNICYEMEIELKSNQQCEEIDPIFNSDLNFNDFFEEIMLNARKFRPPN